MELCVYIKLTCYVKYIFSAWQDTQVNTKKGVSQAICWRHTAQTYASYTNTPSAGQEISPFYRTKRTVTLFTQVHDWNLSVALLILPLAPYPFKVHFNIIVPFTTTSQKLFPPFRSSGLYVYARKQT